MDIQTQRRRVKNPIKKPPCSTLIYKNTIAPSISSLTYHTMGTSSQEMSWISYEELTPTPDYYFFIKKGVDQADIGNRTGRDGWLSPLFMRSSLRKQQNGKKLEIEPDLRVGGEGQWCRWRQFNRGRTLFYTFYTEGEELASPELTSKQSTTMPKHTALLNTHFLSPRILML